jgi:hypothetical protein
MLSARPAPGSFEKRIDGARHRALLSHLQRFDLLQAAQYFTSGEPRGFNGQHDRIVPLCVWFTWMARHRQILHNPARNRNCRGSAYGCRKPN